MFGKGGCGLSSLQREQGTLCRSMDCEKCIEARYKLTKYNGKLCMNCGADRATFFTYFLKKQIEVCEQCRKEIRKALVI